MSAADGRREARMWSQGNGKCRFCQEFIEDPAHAMFIWDNPELMATREIFLTELYKTVPEFQGAFTDAMAFFRAVLAKKGSHSCVGQLAFNVLRIYDATPMLLLEPPAGP